MQSFLQQYMLTLCLLILTLASLFTALALQLTGNDANNAWAAFGGFAVLFGGVHIPSPLSQTTTNNT